MRGALAMMMMPCCLDRVDKKCSVNWSLLTIPNCFFLPWYKAKHGEGWFLFLTLF